MLKAFVIAASIVASSFAHAQGKKEIVEIYNDYSVASSAARILQETIVVMNRLDNKYEYRASSVSGGQGEAAIAAGMAKVKAGSKILFYTGSTQFTFNRYIKEVQDVITYDKDRDFLFLHTLTSTQFAVLVNQNAPFNNVDDLVKYIRETKNPVFFGRTTSAGTASVLGNIFLDQYNLRDKLKIVQYPKIADLNFAMQNKEVDFTIFPPPEFTQAKALLTSGSSRSQFTPDAPTGKEIGFNEFSLQGMTIFYVAKEQAKFGEEIYPMLANLCGMKEVETIVANQKRNMLCMKRQEIDNYISNELKIIEAKRK
jgi:tripartite-type tricarboxylate transporter receptor subunit TctC